MINRSYYPVISARLLSPAPTLSLWSWYFLADRFNPEAWPFYMGWMH